MVPVTGDHPLVAHQGSPARDKLVSILQNRTIFSGPMPYLANSPEAVCFTECIWGALVELADTAYSPYGVVFRKKLIYERGGGPALYVRGDTLKAVREKIPTELEAMVTPFDPEAHLIENVPLDWAHEREWRLPGPLKFEPNDISHVIVDTVEDATDISGSIGLPLKTFIVMEVYRTIRSAWPGGSS